MATRAFLVIALLPVVAGAGVAVYAYRHQHPVPRAIYPRPAGEGPLVYGTPVHRGFLLGAYAGPTPSALAKFDESIGMNASLTEHYTRWGGAFPLSYVEAAAKYGAKTLIDLEPSGAGAPTLHQIAVGQQDAWLKTFGESIKNLGDHIFLSFAPEMNGNWYRWGSKPPAQYLNAWRHVHDVLFALDGKLITWVWQPSAIHITNPSPLPYWPGPKYADVVVLDGFYRNPSDTFNVIFGETLRLLGKLPKGTQIMIGETASGPLTYHQAADIRNLFAGIKHHNLLGLIWYNLNQSALGPPTYQDWHLQDHLRALAAFRSEVLKLRAIATYMVPLRPANGG